MMGRQGMDFGRDEFMQMIGLPYFCGYLKDLIEPGPA